MDQLQTNLVQDSYQKFVYVVANSYRDFNELGTVRARQAFAIWNKYCTSVTLVGVNMAMSVGILIINDQPKEGNISLLFYCNIFLWKPHAKQVLFSYKQKQKMVVMNAVPICPVVSVGKFRVCQSVHHHSFNWINQPDAAISQVYYLSFKYSSTCFGHPHAHHQELK